jgi:MFS family permease
MKLSTFWKGFIMALVGYLATELGNAEVFNLTYTLIVTAGFTVIYLGKNWLFPSVSDRFGVQARDFISGGIIAIGMALMTFAGTLLTDVEFTWLALFKAVGGAVAGYFIKTVPQKGK